MSLKFKTCPACKGAREGWGIDFIIMEKCKNCHGIGYVSDIEDAEEVKKRDAAYKKMLKEGNNDEA